MSAFPNTQEFHKLAARVIWFEPPELALCDLSRFMAYALRYATHEDMNVLRCALNDDDLRSALANAPTGIIDPRSWNYWHAVLGTFPAPAMARRKFGVGELMRRGLNALAR